MEENSRDKSVKPHILAGVVCLLSCAIYTMASFLYLEETLQIIRVIVVSILCNSVIFFLFEVSWEKEDFLFDNKERYFRFLILLLACSVTAVLLPLLPMGGWPYLIIFVFLYLVSNKLLGVMAGVTMLLTSVLLEPSASTSDFFLYFLCGIIGIAVFSCVDEQYRVGIPILVSICTLVVSLCINQFFFSENGFSINELAIAGINVLICILLFFIFLRTYSVCIVHKIRDRYMEINDPECPLLTELKAKSKDEYYHAVHTAYLCDRIAKKLNLDDKATKACGYYHRIGIIRGSNNWGNVNDISKEYNFPQKVQNILEEYIDKNKPLCSKESVVLLFSDTIVSSIIYLFSKDENAQLDYDKLIEAVFHKKLEGDLLAFSDISLSDLRIMQRTFVEEKLYYDFLR